MAKLTIAEKKENYIKIIKAQTDLSIPVDLNWHTHKEADEQLKQLLDTIIVNGTKKINQLKKRRNSKMTLKDLQKEYDNKLLELNGVGDFKQIKFKTKAQAMDALDLVEEFEESPEPKSTKVVNKVAEKKEATKPKQKQKETKMSETIKVNRVQWVILCLFGKKTKMKMDALKDAYMKATGKDKATIVPAQVGMMAKKDLVSKEGEKGEAIITITKTGKAAAKQDEPKVAEKPAPKPKYTPLFTDDEISGMKKKKAKKAQKKQDAHKEAWVKEHGKVTRASSARTPSNYTGGIKKGKWQDDDYKENPNERKACMDLWEVVVTTDFLMTRSELIKLCQEKYNMKGSTPAAIWSIMYKKYDLTIEDVKEILAGGKKAKKGKKSKK